MHGNVGAVQTTAVLIFLPSSVSSKLDRQSHQLQWQAVAKKTSATFVFVDLMPDGFHFWMILSSRTSEPVCHVPVPPRSTILATPLSLAGECRFVLLMVVLHSFTNVQHRLPEPS